MEDITDVIRLINEEGMLTGSYVYGLNGYRDIDVVFPPKVSLGFDDIINLYGGWYLKSPESREHYDQLSCYIKIAEKHYNLIFTYTKEEYECWVYATKMMFAEKKKKNKNLSDKSSRVKLFVKFKEEKRDSLRSNIN